MKISSIEYLINHQIGNQRASLDSKSDQSLPKGYRIEKCRKYEIKPSSQSTQETDLSTQETAQSIFVNIAKVGTPIKIPEGAVFCGGAKGAITLLDIAVCPPNQDIQDRIAEFVVNQEIPPMMMSGPMNIYDKITIDGEVIR